jgi:hypothetical protein
MLVALITAVTGKVLHTQRHWTIAGTLADAVAIGLGVGDHRLVIVAEGPGGDHGVAPVGVDVNDGGERPVATKGPRLASADDAHLPGSVGVGGGRGLQRRGDMCAVGAGAVPACLDVRCDQQGNLRPGLSVPDMCLDTCRVRVVVAHPAGVVGIHDLIDEGVVEPVVQVDEQLPDLLVLIHRINRGPYPRDGLGIQSVRRCAQIRPAHQ